MRFLIFSLLLSCLLCGQSAFAQNQGTSSEQQTTQFDEKLLLGTWKVVSVSGKAVNREMTMTFKSDYTFDQTRKKNDGTIDARSGTWAFGKNLKSLDFTPANEKMTTVQIIRLDKEMFEFYDKITSFVLKKVQ
jgi:Lipocalin-like domain